MAKRKQIPLFPPGPFDDLPQETRDAIAGSTTDQIKARILSAVELREENGKDKKADQHLKEVKQTAKEAAERYAEVEKETKLIIGYGLQVLRDRGTPLEVLPAPKPAPEVDPRQQVLVTVCETPLTVTIAGEPQGPSLHPQQPERIPLDDSARTEALRPGKAIEVPIDLRIAVRQYLTAEGPQTGVAIRSRTGASPEQVKALKDEGFLVAVKGGKLGLGGDK